MKPYLHTFMRAPLVLSLALLCLLSACGQPKPQPGMKLGKPYVIDGKTYYPEYDPSYDKIGVASWYGPGFHGKYTANGEVYNQNDLTAAHPTLPMPSLVRVTNLMNGKSLIVRINDRGPFKSNRIIDLSKKAAREIGMPSTAEVRVQYLKTETEEYLASLQKDEKLDMASYNASVVRQRDSSILSSTEPDDRAPKDQPKDQVIERNESATRSGQLVSSAAPIVSVGAGELNGAKPPAAAIAVSETRPSAAAFNPTHDTAPSGRPRAAEVKISGISDLRQPPAPPSVADSIVPKKTPAPAGREKVAVSGAAPSSFYIQAGSFASEDNAHKLSARLEPVSRVDVNKISAGERTWWRVRAGPFASREEAAEMLAQLKQTGLPDARIVHQ